MNALEIRDLRKVYPGFALEGLDLTLPNGCIMGLLGENGAGKTTVLKLILGLLRRDGGSVSIFGRDNGDDLASVKEDIGVVMDERGIPECLTAVQVSRVMSGVYRQWNQEIFDHYLNKLALPRNKKYKAFSRGMKMKLNIAIAMSHRPKLLLLDEATNGLDPLVRDEVTDIFSEFTRDENHSVLFSSHIVSDIEKICDYVAFLHKGKLLLCEEKDRLKEQYGVLRCSAEELGNISASAVLGKREQPYGVEAIVQRDAVSEALSLGGVDMEQLFIFMVKGGA